MTGQRGFRALAERFLGPGWGVRNLEGTEDPDHPDNRHRVNTMAATFGIALSLNAVVVSAVNVLTGQRAFGYRPVVVIAIAGIGGAAASLVFPFARKLPLWFIQLGAVGVNVCLFAVALNAGEFSPYALMAYIPGATVVAMISRLRPLLVHVAFIGVFMAIVLAVQPGNNAPVSRWLVMMGVLGVSAAAGAYLVTRVAVLADREHEAKKEVEAARAELEIVSRHKSAFLANMSHELRTPLNAILGFSELLEQQRVGELSDKQRDYLADIRTSGYHLLSLINDVLDLAKVEAGKVELEVGPFDLTQTLTEAIRIVRDRAQEDGIALSVSTDPSIGHIRADERKVRQIVLNLLSNGVKFTPRGGRVDVSALQRNGEVEVTVRDTGVGISPDEQGAIFEEFVRAGGGTKKEGTGLGLALAKRFVELHGGRIWVESAPGRGSAFRFTLPARN